MKLYIAIPNTGDGCSMPTSPEAMPLADIGAHLERWLKGYEHQGYFSNCRRERIPLDKLTFTIEYAGLDADENNVVVLGEEG